MASDAIYFDDDCIFMFHMDGPDTSTAFPDSSFTNPKTLTAVGNVQIDTGQSVFGGASCLFDGTGDWLTGLDDPDYDMGTLPFTFDFRVRFNALAAGNFYDMLCVGCREQGPRIEYDVDNTNLSIYTENIVNNFDWTPSTATWYHVAVVRSGTTITAYINGTSIGSYVDGNDLSGGTDGLSVGARSDCAGNRSLPLNGWLDEVRGVKGTAVWTANFTPPTSAYIRRPSGILVPQRKKRMMMGVGL